MTPSSPKKYGPISDCAKECTDATSPLRTLNVPKTARAVSYTHLRAHET